MNDVEEVFELIDMTRKKAYRRCVSLIQQRRDEATDESVITLLDALIEEIGDIEAG